MTEPIAHPQRLTQQDGQRICSDAAGGRDAATGCRADQFPLAGEEVAERNSRTIATDGSGLVLQHSCGTMGASSR